MKSKAITFVITSVLALAILANINPIFATEDEIEELQEDVNEIKDTVEGLQFTLQEGVNELIAICPTLQPQEPEQEQNETQEGCQPIPEPEPEQTVLPPVSAEENQTEGCQPIEEPEQNQSTLEPIICPINGDLLGYLNTTSGEQLPISAVEGNETSQGQEEFLPPIDVPVEEEQPVAPTIEDQCNTNNQTEQQQQPEEQEDQQPVLEEPEINFDDGCGCFTNTSN